jgi:hypothetical protein
MNSHDLLKLYFDNLSKIFNSYYGEPNKEKLPFQKDVHDWLNYFYSSPIFRHIHLEYYKTDKICVLHSNIFPNPTVDLPIMGFDMIALGDKITGLFFDFTPTVSPNTIMDNCLKKIGERFASEKRSLPEWANFFSDNFYCVTPKEGETNHLMSEIFRCIQIFCDMTVDQLSMYKLNIQVQNAYCRGQKKNDKTFKALSKEIGEEDAKTFLENYLFPEIEK